jgi:putative nucleotidyltransferase with HDIG domain
MGEPDRIEGFFEIVTRVTRALHESQDSGEALQILVETIAEVFEAKGCALRVMDAASHELELTASTGLSRVYLDKGRVVADSSLSEVFQDSLVVIDDVESDPRVQYPQAAKEEGVVSIIGVPFQVTGNTRMVLRIYFDRKVEISRRDHHLFHYLAQQSAITIKSSIQHTRYLEAFRKVSSAIHEGQEIHDILETIVSNIRELMEARGCIYWIADTEREQVYMKVTSGFQMGTLAHVGYDTLEAVFSLEQGREVFIEDVRDDGRIPSTTKLGKQMVISILAIPFHIVGQYTGVLAVYFSHQRSMLQSEVDFVRDCGRQGAIALHKAFRYDERMLRAFRETIEGLVLALEAKDSTTHGHSLNVANYARMTARYMGLPEREVEKIYRGGLLHDIGKIAMQDDILRNLGNLCPVDFETIKRHPQMGAEIIKPLTLLNEVVPLVLYHHERYDGSGYPQGLAGEGIPLEARIVAVCDTFDAITSERANTEAMSVQRALNVLQEQSGTKFDSRVIRAFVQAARENRDEIRPVKSGEQRPEQDGALRAAQRSPRVPEWLKRFLCRS